MCVCVCVCVGGGGGGGGGGRIRGFLFETELRKKLRDFQTEIIPISIKMFIKQLITLTISEL